MKLFFFIFLILIFSQCYKELKESIKYKKYNIIKDTTNIKTDIHFDEKLFSNFHDKDKLQLNQLIRNKYKKIPDKALLDTAENYVYGIPFSSIYKKMTEQQYKDKRNIGMKLLLLCMERGIGDAYTIFGDILILYDNTVFNLKDKLKNKKKYEQYILKSIKMSSILGYKKLADWYMRDSNYKNIKESIKIYHYLADSLNDEIGILELHKFYLYRGGIYDEGDSINAKYYFERLIKIKNIYALDKKATILWEDGKKDEAYIYYVECFMKYYKAGKHLDLRDVYIYQFDELLMERYGDKWGKYKKINKINIK